VILTNADHRRDLELPVTQGLSRPAEKPKRRDRVKMGVESQIFIEHCDFLPTPPKAAWFRRSRGKGAFNRLFGPDRSPYQLQ